MEVALFFLTDSSQIQCMNKITSLKLRKLPHEYQVMFMLFCIKQVDHVSKNVPEITKILDLVKKYSVDKTIEAKIDDATDSFFDELDDMGFKDTPEIRAADDKVEKAERLLAEAEEAKRKAIKTAFDFYNTADLVINMISDGTSSASQDCGSAAVAYIAYDNSPTGTKTKVLKAQLAYYDDLLSMVDGRVDEILVDE